MKITNNMTKQTSRCGQPIADEMLMLTGAEAAEFKRNASWYEYQGGPKGKFWVWIDAWGNGLMERDELNEIRLG